ncbi:hypothetical protein FRP1_11165 [Pseudonocardia sp. EC080625-04]|nr:hypothetical protein FRP1_11165 [Pseudonocardia sp. EC080625-04]
MAVSRPVAVPDPDARSCPPPEELPPDADPLPDDEPLDEPLEEALEDEPPPGAAPRSGRALRAPDDPSCAVPAERSDPAARGTAPAADPAAPAGSGAGAASGDDSPVVPGRGVPTGSGPPASGSAGRAPARSPTMPLPMTTAAASASAPIDGTATARIFLTSPARTVLRCLPLICVRRLPVIGV